MFTRQVLPAWTPFRLFPVSHGELETRHHSAVRSPHRRCQTRHPRDTPAGLGPFWDCQPTLMSLSRRRVRSKTGGCSNTSSFCSVSQMRPLINTHLAR